MAGIGFRLRELSRQDSPWASVQVYFLSALVSSGPWIITTINLFLLSLWNPGSIDDVDRAVLFSLITYATVFSFILVGSVSFAFTRYLADQIYLNHNERLLPALNGLLIILLPLASLLGYVFLQPLPLSTLIKFCALMLFLGFIFLWVMMIYISALQNYFAICRAFFIGALAGWGLLWLLGPQSGVAGRLAGFTFGQLLTASLLAVRLFKELEGDEGISFEFLWSFRQRPYLIGAGVFYHLGFWVDKFLLWHSPYGTSIAGLAVCPFYDTALFFAQLSLMSTMTLFSCILRRASMKSTGIFIGKRFASSRWSSLKPANVISMPPCGKALRSS